MQTPPHLQPLTLTCDLDLTSWLKKLKSLDAAYSTLVGLPGMMSVGVIVCEI